MLSQIRRQNFSRALHTKETMQIYRNMPYYLTAIGLFIVLKFGFTIAGNDALTFLLKPTDKLVGFLTGSQSVYILNSGYYHDKLNIVIEKSCSGFNFWILCFLVFTYLALKYFDKSLHKVLSFPIVLTCTYLLTVFVNSSRIFASIVVRNQTIGILPNQQYLLHETIGIITNLSFLILVYYLVEKSLKYRQYAKFA